MKEEIKTFPLMIHGENKSMKSLKLTKIILIRIISQTNRLSTLQKRRKNAKIHMIL